MAALIALAKPSTNVSSHRANGAKVSVFYECDLHNAQDCERGWRVAGRLQPISRLGYAT
jgi:hypothetical protein